MTETSVKLAELVSMQPAAARVLHRLRLDFCCGGQRTLPEACATRGIEPERVLAEIAAVELDDTKTERVQNAHEAPHILCRGAHEAVRVAAKAGLPMEGNRVAANNQVVNAVRVQ